MTMRAIEISIFIMLIQASVVFVNDVGMFSTNYAASPHNAYTEYNVTQLSAGVENPEQMGLMDWFWISVRWVFDGLFIILKMLLAVIVIFPFLVFTFHVPVPLATLIQVGVYVIYWLGYASWKSNRPLEAHT